MASTAEPPSFRPLIIPNEVYDQASGSGSYATARSDSTGFTSCRSGETSARTTGIVNDNFVPAPSTGGQSTSRYMGAGGTMKSFQIGSDFEETLSGSRSSISQLSQQLSQSTGRAGRSAVSEAVSAAELQELTARNEWERNIEQSQLPFSSQHDVDANASYELTEDEAGGGPNTSEVNISGELDIPTPMPTFAGGGRPQDGWDRTRGTASSPRGT